VKVYLKEMSRFKKKDPKWKSFALSMKDREICDPNCKYFFRCPFFQHQNLSKKENKCKIKSLSEDDQKRFISLIVFEEDGLKNEALQILFRLGQTLNLKDDPKEMRMYLESVALVAKTFKKPGKKEEIKEVEPITINMDVMKVDKRTKEYRDSQNEPAIPPNPDENLINDTQSLYASPKLDGILANPKKKVQISMKNG
jgi:hypothetical protein